MFVETLDEHFRFAPYTLKYRLLDQKVEDIRRFATLLVLYRCS